MGIGHHAFTGRGGNYRGIQTLSDFGERGRRICRAAASIDQWALGLPQQGSRLTDCRTGRCRRGRYNPALPGRADRLRQDINRYGDVDRSRSFGGKNRKCLPDQFFQVIG